MKQRNDAFRTKYLRYTREKRLSEYYYISKKDQIIVKHIINNMRRQSFFYKKNPIKERFVYSFRQWYKQFYYFSTFNTSSYIIDQMRSTKKNLICDIYILKIYFLKNVILEKEFKVKRYSGLVTQITRKGTLRGTILFTQKINKTQILHKIFLASPNILAILPWWISLSNNDS